MNGAQRYSFEELREQINKELLNEHMPEHLYKSTDGIMRVINTIVKTKGDNWAAQVLNNEGKPLLNQNEQVKFTEAFQPYLETIIDFFGGYDEMSGGVYKPDMSKLSGMSKDFLKTKAAQATHSFPIPPIDPTKMIGIDDIYAKIFEKIGNVNSTVNEYASKYGVLKLEKEHDLEEDVRVVPQPAALAISEGVFALSTSAGLPIPPNVTLEVLSKIKVPFRTIVFLVYLILDVSRLAIGITGPPLARKIMSILLSILELLKGDWKKAVLTIIGYYGMIPLVVGELLKVVVTLFRMLAPQIQHSIIFGSLDAAKSLVIGLLLSIFQVTAPEQVRLPLIGVLEKIAQRKAEIDGELVDEGLSARPDYLSPTFEDLNNIQAVMSDEAYLCSCEFDTLIDAVDKSAIIRIILQILRIPVNKDFKEYKCGPGPCKPFVKEVVSRSMKDKEKADELQEGLKLKLPIQLNPDDILTAPVAAATNAVTGAVTGATNAATNAATKAVTNAITGATNAVTNSATKAVTNATNAATNAVTGATNKAASAVSGAVDSVLPDKAKEGEEEENNPKAPENNKRAATRGGRILHTRKMRSSMLA